MNERSKIVVIGCPANMFPQTRARPEFMFHDDAKDLDPGYVTVGAAAVFYSDDIFTTDRRELQSLSKTHGFTLSMFRSPGALSQLLESVPKPSGPPEVVKGQKVPVRAAGKTQVPPAADEQEAFGEDEDEDVGDELHSDEQGALDLEQETLEELEAGQPLDQPEDQQEPEDPSGPKPNKGKEAMPETKSVAQITREQYEKGNNDSGKITEIAVKQRTDLKRPNVLSMVCAEIRKILQRKQEGAPAPAAKKDKANRTKPQAKAARTRVEPSPSGESLSSILKSAAALLAKAAEIVDQGEVDKEARKKAVQEALAKL